MAKILMIDDDPDILTAIRIPLEASGHEFFEAISGEEGLEKIKEINPSVVRILITGYSDINIVIEALNDGLVWKYVAKPWEHDQLRDLVLKGARQYLQEEGLDEEEYGFNRGFIGI